MARLTAFATCNEVLSDDEANPTLVHLFTAVIVLPKAGEDFPANSLVERKWSVFTMWQADSDDIGQPFEQKCIIEVPDGSEFGSATSRFIMGNWSHHLKLAVPGLPVGVEGILKIRIWLERDGNRLTGEHITSIAVHHRAANEIKKATEP